MSDQKWPAVLATTEKIKTILDSNPENIERFVTSYRYSNIGNIIGGIAHTFNNVLGGILGYSQLLKEEVAADSNAYRHATIIESAAKRAANLIALIYSISNHGKSDDIRLVDPQTLVEEVATLLRSSFPPSIIINTIYNHDGRKIKVDYAAMCQALLNICLNARDAMPKGGEITIATYCYEMAASGSAAEQVTFKIIDTGEGIPPELLPRVFEPFVSTRAQHVAGGLGLTIAKAILHDQGGEITIESQVGRGTVVSLHLPAAKLPPTTIETSVETPASNEPNKLIMVVDDEDDLRALAKSIFERKGYRVVLADSGDRALEIFDVQGDNIRLVILDVAMPGLGTEEVYHRLRARNPNVKIILTSGHTRYSAHLEFLQKTDSPFIQKPWDLPQLLREVRQQLNEC